MKFRYGYNIKVAETTATRLHSLMQNYAGQGLAVEGVTITVEDSDIEAFISGEIISREQMAAILCRYAKDKGIDVSVGENTNILSYGDAVAVSEWAIPAMQ